jgi:hypothetical protein
MKEDCMERNLDQKTCANFSFFPYAKMNIWSELTILGMVVHTCCPSTLALEAKAFCCELNSKFIASLDYVMRSCLKKRNENISF